MINSIGDLVRYSETVSDAELGDPPLSEPGMSADELDELRERFPGLPESYIDTLGRVQVFGREIGPFRLSPPPDDEHGTTFADALEHWNENVHLSDDLKERDLVVLAGGDGNVIWLDWRSDDDVVERDLAPSYFDLLLLIARYDEALAEADENGEDEPEPDELVDRIGEGIDLTDEQRSNLELLFS